MRARWFAGLALLWALGAAAPVPLAAAETAQPSMVFRVRSLDALIAGTRYLAGLAGAEEKAKQFEGIIKARIGRKGLDGIDPKRPFGAYASDFNDNPVVVMVPVADEKALVNLLKGLKLEPEKGKDGIYTLTPEFVPFEIYFRVAQGYAYVAFLSPGMLAKEKLLPPSILKPRGQGELASASLYLSRLPGIVRQLVLANVEKQLNKLQQQKPPNETEAQEQFRVRVLKDLAAQIKSVANEGDEVSFQLDVDRQAGKVAAQASLTAKDGSDLATKLLNLGQSSSLFTALAGDHPTAAGLVHLKLPEDLRKALAPLIDDGLKQLRDRETDDTRQALLDSLIKAVKPTLKAGELDYAVSIRGPSKGGLYGGVYGLKIRDGGALEKVVRDLIAKVSPHIEKVKFKLDAHKVEGVAVHSVSLKEVQDEKVAKAFGEGPVYFGFRKDALLVTWGDNALDLIKEAVAVQPKTGPFIHYEASFGKMLPLFKVYGRNDKFAEMARDVFGGETRDNGLVRFTLQGGKALRARFRVSGQVIKLFSQAIVLQKRAEAE
jgi:hypothetical protein